LLLRVNRNTLVHYCLLKRGQHVRDLTSGATSGCVSGVFMLRSEVERLTGDGWGWRSEACGGVEEGLRKVVVEERLRTTKFSVFVGPL
jgi:hypothetical protein